MMYKPIVLLTIIALIFKFQQVQSAAYIVQTLSSRYAIVLGGYGPGYKEEGTVDVVKHDKVCSGVLKDVPKKLSRYLGDLSGMAEYVDDSVMFCRDSSCWKLDIFKNKWTKVGGFLTERNRAASAAVGGNMIVLGGVGNDGSDLINFEVFNSTKNAWETRPEWEMARARYSFCAVPVNDTSLLVIGGYSKYKGPLSTVELLNTVTGKWESLQDLPQARYGHSCLMMELGGREGILVSGGALTGSKVDFLDLKTGKWEHLPDLEYNVDGHKMVLVEGIPTVFSWEHIEQFNGKQWVTKDFRLSHARSAFTVTSIPGHLVRNCH